MKSWQRMNESEKRASYRYSGTGFFSALAVTVISTEDLFAGIFNGIIIAALFQLIYQARL
jgi:hypothetical protein